MYSSQEEMTKTALSLIIMSTKVFKRAKIIREIELMKRIQENLDTQVNPPTSNEIFDLGFEFLIDSVRVIIFFENYMKAELIMNEICVHLLNKDVPNFKKLAQEQRGRPISTKEIHDILPFNVDEKGQTIFHKAVKETTLNFYTLTGNNYIKFYKFDDSILNFIKELNKNRNQLHLYDSVSFELSRDLINKFRLTNEFVDTIFQAIVMDTPST